MLRLAFDAHPPWWRHRDFPLYLAAGLGSSAWILAVTSTIGDMRFASLILALNALGCGSSFLLRLLGQRNEGRFPPWFVPSVYLRVLLFLFVLLPGFSEMPPFVNLFPYQAQGSSEYMTGVLFLWGHVLYSFTMFTDSLLLMSAVPGLSMFGLMATTNVNPGMMVLFLLFLLGYLYATAHITFYQELERGSQGLGERVWTLERVGEHLWATTLLVSLLALLSLPMSWVVQATAPRVFPLAGIMARLSEDYVQFINHYSGFSSQFRVGTGPVSLGSRVVMLVRCDSGESVLLLRGMVYDVYTGHGWEQSQFGTREVISQEEGQRAVHFNQRQLARWAPRPWVVQEVEVVLWMPGLFFALAEPVEIFSPLVARVRVSPYGTLFASMRMPTGARYRVVSAVPAYSPEELRRAGTDAPAAIQEQYLSLPLGLDELRALTQRIVAEAPTPYDQAIAIKRYLETHCVYGEGPRVPWGEDAATYFVLESKQGVCDLFATAMAVMARLAGIPARVATGFLAQSRDPSTGQFIVREQDAHAWAELYFPGHGWIPFDPQAERVDTLMEVVDSWLNRGRGFRPTLKKMGFWLLFFGLLGWLLAWVIQGWVGMRWREWRHRAWLRQTLRGQVVEAYLEMQRLLARQGYRRSPEETPGEFLERLEREASGSRWLPACAGLTELFHQARYSPRRPSPTQVQRAQELLHTLRHNLRRPPTAIPR